VPDTADPLLVSARIGVFAGILRGTLNWGTVLLLAIRILLVLLLAACLAASASAAATPRTVDVTFVSDGRFVRVERVVPKGVRPEVHALRELLQGPTKVERAQGLRSAFRPGGHLQSVRIEDDLWLVRLSRSALGPSTPQTMERRFVQLSSTLGRLGSPGWAALSAEGRLVTTFRIGVRPSPWRAARGEKGYPYGTRGVQLRLWLLGFLDRSAVTGSLDYATSQALLAFQGWEELARTGTLTGETQLALFRADRPRPTTHRLGRRIEIHRDEGVLLMVEDNEVRRAVHTSTGAYGATPAGSYRVYRKERLSWSVPFSVWMPYAAYFLGGIATHEYPDVPSYPASHGCVRLPAGDAQRVWRFVDVGTPVHVS
jgi:L,D-transpeptidase catalytic domain/Sporulation and spore germination